MNSFDHMVLALQSLEQEKAKYSTAPAIQAFINPNGIKVSKKDYAEFQKNFVFEKLKGKTLAKSFSETFKIDDILFALNISDKETEQFIKAHYIEK